MPALSWKNPHLLPVLPQDFLTLYRVMLDQPPSSPYKAIAILILIVGLACSLGAMVHLEQTNQAWVERVLVSENQFIIKRFKKHLGEIEANLDVLAASIPEQFPINHPVGPQQNALPELNPIHDHAWQSAVPELRGLGFAPNSNVFQEHTAALQPLMFNLEESRIRFWPVSGEPEAVYQSRALTRLWPQLLSGAQEAVVKGATRLALSHRQGDAAVSTAMLIRPVYRQGARPPTELERWQQVLGWSFALIDLDQILAEVRLDARFFRIEITDITLPGQSINVYQSQATDNSKWSSSKRPLSLYGKRLAVETQMSQHFLDQQPFVSPVYVFLAGCIASVLLASFCFAANAGRKAKREVANLSGRLHSLLTTTPDAVIRLDSAGRVLEWSANAEAILGYSALECVDKPLAHLIVPEGLKHEQEQLFSRAFDGEVITNFRTRRLRKNGESIYCSLSMAPVFELEKIVCVALVLRNVGSESSAHQQAENLSQAAESQVQQQTQELIDTQVFLRRLIDFIPPAIAYVNKSLALVVVNEAFGELFNQPKAQLEGRKLTDVVHQDFIERTLANVATAFRGELSILENTIKDNSGKEKNIVTHFIPDYHEDQVKGVSIITYDVTESARNQRRLSQLASENGVLLTTINDQLIYTISAPLGHLTYVNENYCKSIGYRRDQVLGMAPEVYASEASKRALWPEIMAHLQTGKAWRGELCERHRDGHWVWFQGVVLAALDTQGEVEYIVSLRFDITAQKLAEIERERLNSWFNNMLDSPVNVAIIACDNDGRATIFNRGAETLFGYAREEILGESFVAKIHHQNELEKLMRESGASNLDGGFDIQGAAKKIILSSQVPYWTYVRKDGSTFLGKLTLSPLTDSKGNVIGCLGQL